MPETRRSPDASSAARFSIVRLLDPGSVSTLADDVREGLQRPQKVLPSKYFYDERGSQLFDEICDLPEYYPTRTEHALLHEVGVEVMRAACPTDLVELGSGAARKTRALLDAAGEIGLTGLRYHPVDVCEPMLESSGRELVEEYPWLEVHAVVADYEQHLEQLPDGERRLVAFLGSTIGNFPPAEARSFLRGVAAQLRPEESFLLGVDLVKPIEQLEAAYNDSRGVTAEFNRNVLRVINRELDADFDPDRFEHVAFFDREQSQIEMRLRSRVAQTVTIRALALEVRFREGETIRTEISRKFREEELRADFATLGFDVTAWYTPPDAAFALLLARRT